jgi:IclR family acetate operon transcriptional repressor
MNRPTDSSAARAPATTRARRAGAKRIAGHAQALSRGLGVLEYLASTPGGATLTALAAALQLPAPTAHRLLATLEDAGYVQAGDDGRFRIGVRAYRVGSAFLEHRNLVAEALPRLERLMESSGETANLAVIENGAAVFVAQVPCRELMRMNARLGARAPLHASGVGKAMLAAMPARDADALVGRGPLARYTERTLVSRPALAEALARSAERGYAIDDEEHAAGLRCVASAIADEAGRPWAAVSLAGPTSRLPQDRLAELGERVRAAARDITAALGGMPASSRGKEPR